jgi:Ser/Thr protein kinase RdoA (MazF antagonist)
MSLSINQIHTWVSHRYSLPEQLLIEPFRAYTNDVFLLTTPTERWVLKIYGIGWRSKEEVYYEADLLTHLARRGIRVALPILGINQQAVQTITRDQRCAMIFEWAGGHKPHPPFPPALYEQEGRAVAMFHQASDDFFTIHARRPMDLTFLLDSPATTIFPLLTASDDRVFFHSFLEQLGCRITAFADRGLDWGPCHGDVTFDNVHITDDGDFIWYDFDSGGTGWRALDLQGWAAHHPEAATQWNAFRRGYQQVRPIDAVNFEAAPYLSMAQHVWGLEVDLIRRVLAQGEEAVHIYLTSSLDILRARATRLGFGD